MTVTATRALWRSCSNSAMQVFSSRCSSTLASSTLTCTGPGIKMPSAPYAQLAIQCYPLISRIQMPQGHLPPQGFPPTPSPQSPALTPTPPTQLTLTDISSYFSPPEWPQGSYKPGPQAHLGLPPSAPCPQMWSRLHRTQTSLKSQHCP